MLDLGAEYVVGLQQATLLKSSFVIDAPTFQKFITLHIAKKAGEIKELADGGDSFSW